MQQFTYADSIFFFWKRKIDESNSEVLFRSRGVYNAHGRYEKEFGRVGYLEKWELDKQNRRRIYHAVSQEVDGNPCP